MNITSFFKILNVLKASIEGSLDYDNLLRLSLHVTCRIDTGLVYFKNGNETILPSINFLINFYKQVG